MKKRNLYLECKMYITLCQRFWFDVNTQEEQKTSKYFVQTRRTELFVKTVFVGIVFLERSFTYVSINTFFLFFNHKWKICFAISHNGNLSFLESHLSFLLSKLFRFFFVTNRHSDLFILCKYSFFFCLSRLISWVMIQRNPSMAESFEDLINIGLLKLYFENLP